MRVFLLCLLLALTSTARAEEEGIWLPGLPKIFDVDLTGNPRMLVARLENIGYRREMWELRAPYSHIVFRQEDPKAVFRSIDLLICNHPFKLAQLRIEGRERDALYQAIKDRFGLTIAEKEPDAGFDRHGKYNKAFADKTWIVLESHRKEAAFTFEAPLVKAGCRRALASDIEVFRKADEAQAIHKRDSVTKQF